jgi:hypothetical protein
MKKMSFFKLYVLVIVFGIGLFSFQTNPSFAGSSESQIINQKGEVLADNDKYPEANESDIEEYNNSEQEDVEENTYNDEKEEEYDSYDDKFYPEELDINESEHKIE